jgi:hypothetical protein
MILETTYILTAELDRDSFAWLDALRRQHFPPKRIALPAHLTMFHRLSSAQVDGLRHLKIPDAPIQLRFDRVVFLGFGVALHVQCEALEQLRNKIPAAVGGEFSRQDSQPWKPHVTIQNRAPAEKARQLERTLTAEFSERAGAATALLVWEYLGGPWKIAERIAFARAG